MTAGIAYKSLSLPLHKAPSTIRTKLAFTHKIVKARAGR
jgi:hypothetical protein